MLFRSLSRDQNAGGNRQGGMNVMTDLLTAHPQIDAVFAINDPSALGANAALEKAGKDKAVIVVGFDGQPEGLEAIAQGKVYADPVQFPDRMGREIVAAIIAHSRGEAVRPEILIPTSLVRKADAIKALNK